MIAEFYGIVHYRVILSGMSEANGVEESKSEAEFIKKAENFEILSFYIAPSF